MDWILTLSCELVQEVDWLSGRSPAGFVCFQTLWTRETLQEKEGFQISPVILSLKQLVLLVLMWFWNISDNWTKQ